MTVAFRGGEGSRRKRRAGDAMVLQLQLKFGDGGVHDVATRKSVDHLANVSLVTRVNGLAGPVARGAHSGLPTRKNGRLRFAKRTPKPTEELKELSRPVADVENGTIEGSSGFLV